MSLIFKTKKKTHEKEDNRFCLVTTHNTLVLFYLVGQRCWLCCWLCRELSPGQCRFEKRTHPGPHRPIRSGRGFPFWLTPLARFWIGCFLVRRTERRPSKGNGIKDSSWPPKVKACPPPLNSCSSVFYIHSFFHEASYLRAKKKKKLFAIFQFVGTSANAKAKKNSLGTIRNRPSSASSQDF